MAEEYLTSKDDAITVPFSDDQTEAEIEKDEELPANASPQQLSEAKRKKQERGKQREDERRRERERADTLANELATLKQELARTQGYIAAQQNQPPQPADGKDDYDRRLEAIEERRALALAAAQAEVASGKITPERQKYWDEQGLAFEKERTDVHVERALARKSAEDAVRQQQNEGQQFWKQRHPEVYSDPKAAYWARARAMQRIAEGEPDGRELVESVMEEAKVKFKLGKPPAPAANLRERMSGVSSGGGSSSASGGGGFTFSNEKVKAMAVAAYSHLPEKEALKAWAQKTGKKLRDRKVL